MQCKRMLITYKYRKIVSQQDDTYFEDIFSMKWIYKEKGNIFTISIFKPGAH